VKNLKVKKILAGRETALDGVLKATNLIMKSDCVKTSFYSNSKFITASLIFVYCAWISPSLANSVLSSLLSY